MVKILVASRALPAHGGGGMEVAAWDLMSEWSASGHEVVGLTTPGSSGFSGAPFEVRVLPGVAGGYSEEWFRATVAAAEQIRPEVVFGVSAGAHEMVKSSAADVVTIMQAHGTSIEEARSALSSRSLSGVRHALGQIPGMLRDWDRYPKYDALVAVGPGIAQAIKSYPRRARPTRLEIIENGISLPSPVPTDCTLPPLPFAAFVGRLSHDKGPDLAIEALKYWPGNLVIIGDGPFDRDLRERVARLGLGKRVNFFGRLSRPEISWVLSSACAVLAPSRRREGLPLVALEALAAGLPLVTSQSVADTFGASRPTGILVGGAEPRRIGALLTDAEILVKSGRVRLPDTYTLEVSARRYIELFDELLTIKRRMSGGAAS